MAGSRLPFEITICGLDELADHAGRRVSHVLSIIDPDRDEPEAFGSYGEHARLELKFHDIVKEIPGQIAPEAHDVARILEFGRDMLREPANVRHLLVHCHMGISRSTAAMALLLAQAEPDRSADEILGQVLEIREKAWPNIRILEFGARQLGREEEFVAAAAKVYRNQLAIRPEIKKFFVDIGREREIEMAQAA